MVSFTKVGPPGYYPGTCACRIKEETMRWLAAAPLIKRSKLPAVADAARRDDQPANIRTSHPAAHSPQNIGS